MTSFIARTHDLFRRTLTDDLCAPWRWVLGGVAEWDGNTIPTRHVFILSLIPTLTRAHFLARRAFNAETIRYRGDSIHLWDLGGARTEMSYCDDMDEPFAVCDVHAVVFLIDASDDSPEAHTLTLTLILTLALTLIHPRMFLRRHNRSSVPHWHECAKGHVTCSDILLLILTPSYWCFSPTSTDVGQGLDATQWHTQPLISSERSPESTRMGTGSIFPRCTGTQRCRAL